MLVYLLFKSFSTISSNQFGFSYSYRRIFNKINLFSSQSYDENFLIKSTGYIKLYELKGFISIIFLMMGTVSRIFLHYNNLRMTISYIWCKFILDISPSELIYCIFDDIQYNLYRSIFLIAYPGMKSRAVYNSTVESMPLAPPKGY